MIVLASIGNLKFFSNIMNYMFKILYVLTAAKHSKHTWTKCWSIYIILELFIFDITYLIVLVRINHLVLDNSSLQILQHVAACNIFAYCV